MRGVHHIAPRVAIYPFGSKPPPSEPGWIALAQFPQADHPAVFGDGSHPTTRLCAAALDFLCRQRQREAVLDVGTGTGVLARIARARGATLVVGTDIDAAALSSANAHSHLDGSPVEIHFSDQAPDVFGARFDLVVANILEASLRSLAPALCRALRPGSILLLSGFTRPQAPGLRVLYEDLGVACVRDSGLEDWVLLMFARGNDSQPDAAVRVGR
jgi:ribosomal protein L11 methyltransferase